MSRLVRQKKAVLTDRQLLPTTGRKKLTIRLLARRCEQGTAVEVR